MIIDNKERILKVNKTNENQIAPVVVNIVKKNATNINAIELKIIFKIAPARPIELGRIFVTFSSLRLSFKTGSKS